MASVSGSSRLRAETRDLHVANPVSLASHAHRDHADTTRKVECDERAEPKQRDLLSANRSLRRVAVKSQQQSLGSALSRVCLALNSIRFPFSRGLVINVALLGLGLIGGCEAAQANEKVALSVDRGDLVLAGNHYGEIHASESEKILAPSMSGVWTVTVEHVVKDGTEVKEGDELIRLDKTELTDDLRNQETELAVAEAEEAREVVALQREKIDLELEVQRRELLLERAKLGVVEGVNLISKIQLEKAKTEVARAELELKLSRDALKAFEKKRVSSLKVKQVQVQDKRTRYELTKSHLEKMVIRAPSSGVVYAPYTQLNWRRSKVAAGKVARPGDTLLEIPELSKLEAHLFVRQRDAALMQPGDSAVVYAATHPKTKIMGKIESKEDFARTRNERLGTETPDGSLKEVQVVIALDNPPKGLLPGNTVRAEMTSKVAENVIRVPLIALKETEKGYTAQLESGEVRKVKIGKTSVTHGEVLNGLKEGDRVILPDKDGDKDKEGAD